MFTPPQMAVLPPPSQVPLVWAKALGRTAKAAIVAATGRDKRAEERIRDFMMV